MAPLSPEEYYYKADNLNRSSCLTLQAIFRQRWKNLTGSEWTEQSAPEFIAGRGAQIYASSMKLQKKAIEKGCLEEWDISILSKVLSQFKAGQSPQKCKEESSAIQSLANLRNKVAHNALKKLSSEEYTEFEDVFRQNMLILGLHETHISKLITHAGVTSSVAALEQSKLIQEKGDLELGKGCYQEAIQFYNEALMVPSLLPVNQGTLYEKRASSYLAFAKQKESENGDGGEGGLLAQAEKDIEMALELNENSWKGHEILGHIFKEKHDIKNAIKHLTRALAISPGQGNIWHELESCKLLAGIMDRDEHLNPLDMPDTLSEFTEAVGLTEELFLKLRDSPVFPGQDHQVRGMQYLHGWKVKMDPTEAAKHFAKAARSGNACGIVNLAQLHLAGKGVKKDIPYAIELFRKAANMPPTFEVRGGITVKDDGVRGAQHSLGLMYQEGTGVPQSLTEAAFWYKKAADNGNGKAANNLARLYYTGKGVVRNEKMAVMYWKLAVEQKSIHAARFLYEHYADHLEPVLARRMFGTAIDLGYEQLKGIRTNAYKMFDEIEMKRKMVEPEVSKFEAKHKLSTRDTTFKERFLRMKSWSNPEITQYLQELENFEMCQFNSHTRWAGKLGKLDEMEILRKSCSGSVTATNLLKTTTANFKFLQLWKGGPPYPYSPSQIENIIHALYSFFSMEPQVFQLQGPENAGLEIQAFLQKQLSSRGNDRSEIDKKIRYCYGVITYDNDDNKFGIEVLKEGIKRYPDEVHLYEILSNIYGKTRKHKLGLELALGGLEIDPENVALKYTKATHLRLLDEINPERVREAFADFVQVAPADHRMVPDAYYNIAVTYHPSISKGNRKLSRNHPESFMEKLEYYYEQGKAAEKIQLSCYLPYTSSAKTFLQPIIESLRNTKRKPSTSLQTCTIAPSSIPTPSTSQSPKRYLEDPRRVEIIKTHREFIRKMRNVGGPASKSDSLAVQPKLTSNLPKQFSTLSAIKLAEMNPTRDNVYENRILNLTLIEDPLVGFPSFHLVAEDEDGDVTRLYVYNIPQNKATCKTLGFGKRLSVINPYFRIAMDLTCGIRVDNPKSLIYMEGVEKMCRYCGEENAPQNCSKCKFARYCGKECQVKDWKRLNHKSICE